MPQEQTTGIILSMFTKLIHRRMILILLFEDVITENPFYKMARG